MWLENAKSQLEPLNQIITLLLINKKLIITSDELRDEVIPKLNSLQIKQVLAMYTPTDTEETVSLSDISKFDQHIKQREKGKEKTILDDQTLLLESSEVFKLSSKEMHYLELEDAENIPLPSEIKEKIHEIVENDILKRMSAARRVVELSRSGPTGIHPAQENPFDEAEDGDDDGKSTPGNTRADRGSVDTAKAKGLILIPSTHFNCLFSLV